MIPLKNATKGTIFAVSAFLIWGLSPLYWKQLKEMPAFEILMHRTIWSCLLLQPLLIISGKAGMVWDAVKNIKLLGLLLLTSTIVASNWFVFIWAVNNEMVLQASLGYYMNPLVNVLLGMVFLKERLRPLQKISVLLAGTSVLYITTLYGQFPWLAIFLAVSFGFYGLIRKMITVGALEGLFIETMILSCPAACYLLFLGYKGEGSFLHLGIGTDLMIMASALVTAIPLLLFTAGARRIHFSTLGFIQYLAPSCSFLLAVLVYREPLLKGQITSFIMIWTALAIYSSDSILQYKKTHNK